MSQQYVYYFDEGKGLGKDVLGGKGANLAEMTSLGIPVPPGFTITTEVCDIYHTHNKKYPKEVLEQVHKNIERLEKEMNAGLGDKENPLLVSVRSGAKVSMPGMMDTVLNLGLNDDTVLGLIRKTNNERFAWDSYRRFINMFGDVVMSVEHKYFEEVLTTIKEEKNVRYDTDLSASDLKKVVKEYKSVVKKHTGTSFPDDPKTQLQMAIDAVFESWMGKRAIAYRRIHDIKGLLGTAVNVQAMVFGNMGDNSATGVAFTRDPSTGENKFYGEFLINAQGEDVVAGIRTPLPISQLQELMPKAYKKLESIYKKLEHHYKDMQDIEFTIQEGELFMLQTRTGKRTAHAAIRIAVEMEKEGLIDKNTALLRVDPNQLNQLLHKQFDPEEKQKAKVIGKGLPASPGAAVGQVVFTAEKAHDAAEDGKTIILVRTETSPEDIEGMHAAQGILTARGGMTCIAEDGIILTNKGFLRCDDAYEELKWGEKLYTLSFDSKTGKTEWKKIIAAGRKVSDVIEISVSQTGRSGRNTIKVTNDHKFLVIKNRSLEKKPISSVLNNKEFVTVVDKIPYLDKSIGNQKLAYVVGALITDGYLSLKKTKGSVTFTQKDSPEKKEFISTVNTYFEETFNKRFNLRRKKTSHNYIGDRLVHGEALDLICTSMEPALILSQIKENIVPWVLSLDEESTLSFLAGVIDGDGTFDRKRIQIYASKECVRQGVVAGCLKLGILPQITINRNISNIQICENQNDILRFTKRIKGNVSERKYGQKLFSVNQLFNDIVDDVNFRGRVKEGIKRNLLFDGKKIERDILPLCREKEYDQLSSILKSDLRMYRVSKLSEGGKTWVYNFEVEGKEELDKNFVVFTKMYSPLLVSNSHAAVVARGMGKCCVAGCGDIFINEEQGFFTAKDGVKIKEMDWISVNGSEGVVYLGQVPVKDPEISGYFETLMKWADQTRKLKVRTNADTPHDSEVAIKFGAEGIGLCRTEHMFFEGERIKAVREMILAETEEERRKALAKLEPFQKSDFVGIFKVMTGLPVTIRLLDPPLHEFLPKEEKDIKEIAQEMNVSVEKLKNTITLLHEFNPMLGFRGCRLGVVYPEIFEMQTSAIIKAAIEVNKAGLKALPEIEIPVVANVKEIEVLKEKIIAVAEELMTKSGVNVHYKIGTMVELPRACVTADEMAPFVEFMSFGTNDLTQTTYGFSRDDAGKFIPNYIEQGIFDKDPFQEIDRKGVGALMKICVEKAKSVKKDIEFGICGEHGGDPNSVEFCHQIGLDYVSCSPFRVPIARLAAAQAVIKKV